MEDEKDKLISRLKTDKVDADIMFDALFKIISDPEIDTVHKCMDVAGEAINQLLSKFDHGT